MRVLSARRWLLLTWLFGYFLTNAITFGGITWWTFHEPSNLSPLRFVIPIQFLLQVVLAIVTSAFVGRALLKPLAAMSQSARQIAGGDLNFTLPPSQVREVAEVAAAFQEMGKALQLALARQAELEQQRRMFISAIAHDLRTPLFSLRGYLEGLETGIATTPEKIMHYVKVCQEKADDLEKRISDLFAYARLEYMEQSPRYESFEMVQMLYKVVESFRPRLEARRIELKLPASPGPCVVRGDASLLTRVFENLLDNAICYTPVGSTVWLDWTIQADKFRFKVIDSGPGFAPEDIAHLFEPSYRGKTAHLRQSGGAGLGLTIARRVLISHGGNLQAVNSPQGGAEFQGYFSLNSEIARSKSQAGS